MRTALVVGIQVCRQNNKNVDEQTERRQTEGANILTSELKKIPVDWTDDIRMELTDNEIEPQACPTT